MTAWLCCGARAGVTGISCRGCGGTGGIPSIPCALSHHVWLPWGRATASLSRESPRPGTGELGRIIQVAQAGRGRTGLPGSAEPKAEGDASHCSGPKPRGCTSLQSEAPQREELDLPVTETRPRAHTGNRPGPRSSNAGDSAHAKLRIAEARTTRALGTHGKRKQHCE